MASLQTPDLRSAESAQRRVRLAAALFLLIGCALQWWRMQSLTAVSYTHLTLPTIRGV